MRITDKHTNLIAFILKLEINKLDQCLKSEAVKNDLILKTHYHHQRTLLREYYLHLRINQRPYKSPGKRQFFLALLNKSKRFFTQS